MKLVKLFNKLSAVALAASLVVGFASCSTTTDDPFNPNAPLTLEEYVKSEIKKAIENGGAPAKPEDPSELEFESRTSLMDKIQLNNEKTEDAWGNGTKISSANPLQASEGYGWDVENGQISLPFAYDAGYFGENTHIIIEADDSALNYNADAAIKIEFKVENPSTSHSNEMNITSKFKDGVAIIPISEIGFTDSCQFLLTFRAKGTVTIKNIDMAKAKGQSAPEPTPGEGEKPGAGEEPTPVKSIELVKNQYATAPQTQVKIPFELTSLSVGDKVKVAFSGTADREIGNVELMIVDTTEEARYWTALSETKKHNFSTDINVDFEFVITKTPIGTGANSMVLAINGLDSDEAATIKCTSFSIEKIANEEPAGGENNDGGGEEGGDSVVFDDAIPAVELSPNHWDGNDNGIQYHVANAFLFPDGIEAGDKYKFEMTGSVTGGPITQKFIIVIDNDTYNPNNVQNYFVNDPDVSGKSAEECLSEGITVTMTFDAAIESSKVVLWIYTEGPRTAYDAETTASKTATINFSSFKITKVE